MHFFSINPWCNACFKVLMCATYLFSSYILHTSLLHFLIIILSSKNGKSLWRLWGVLRYSISTSKMYPMQIFLSYFYKLFIKFRHIYFHLKPTTGNLWGIIHPYRLFASKYVRYDDPFFVILFRIFIICCCISMYSMTYSSANVFFYP